ncbi:MAG: DUF4157 domain-containing protein [Deltaproteobacteria bacterium]|nr:DUF4157 domain-containing protein [Deltaproteobacteria bacterium]
MSEKANLTTKTPELKSNHRSNNSKETDFSPSHSINSPVDQIMFLQRTIGNQAVQRMLQQSRVRGQVAGVRDQGLVKRIQAKLKIGQPNDKYEQEADRVADQVMRMDESSRHSAVGRRQVQPEEGEEVQTKSLFSQNTPLIQRQVEEEKEEKIQTKQEYNAQVKRQEEDPEIMTKSDAGHKTASSNIQNQLNASKGSGSPLPKDTRTSMESSIGQDFSGVQIHTDSNAIQMNQMLNAQAFTHGSDVYFNKGKYSPNTNFGKHLLAHELTHVVQQSHGSNKKLNPKILGKQDKTVRRSVVNYKTPSDRVQRDKEGQLESGGAGGPEGSLGPIVKSKKVTHFPIFVGPKGAALKDIGRQIKKDPRSPKMTNADLDRVKIPKGKKNEENYEVVLNQLRTEVSLRVNAKEYFNELKHFVQILHASFQNRLKIVNKFMDLKNSDVVNILINRLVSEALEAIGEIDKVVAKVVSEVLKIVWDTYFSAKAAANANKVSKKVIDAIVKLDQDFNHAISNVEKFSNDVLTDWGKLQKVGKLTWPKTTTNLRAAAGTAYEMKLWKQLLPIKWKVFKGTNRPMFFKSKAKAEAFIKRMYKKHSHVYEHMERVDEESWTGDRHGYTVREYWLGSGSHPLTHSTPDVDLMKRILSLGVSRKEIMFSWGLKQQTMATAPMGGII